MSMVSGNYQIIRFRQDCVRAHTCGLRSLWHALLMHELPREQPLFTLPLPHETVKHRLPALSKVFDASEQNEPGVDDHFGVLDGCAFGWDVMTASPTQD